MSAESFLGFFFVGSEITVTRSIVTMKSTQSFRIRPICAVVDGTGKGTVERARSFRDLFMLRLSHSSGLVH